MKLVHTHFLSYYQREFELKRWFIRLHIFYFLLLDTEVSEFCFLYIQSVLFLRKMTQKGCTLSNVIIRKHC